MNFSALRLRGITRIVVSKATFERLCPNIPMGVSAMMWQEGGTLQIDVASYVPDDRILLCEGSKMRGVIPYVSSPAQPADPYQQTASVQSWPGCWEVWVALDGEANIIGHLSRIGAMKLCQQKGLPFPEPAPLS